MKTVKIWQNLAYVSTNIDQKKITLLCICIQCQTFTILLLAAYDYYQMTIDSESGVKKFDVDFGTFPKKKQRCVSDSMYRDSMYCYFICHLIYFQNIPLESLSGRNPQWWEQYEGWKETKLRIFQNDQIHFLRCAVEIFFSFVRQNNGNIQLYSISWRYFQPSNVQYFLFQHTIVAFTTPNFGSLVHKTEQWTKLKKQFQISQCIRLYIIIFSSQYFLKYFNKVAKNENGDHGKFTSQTQSTVLKRLLITGLISKIVTSIKNNYKNAEKIEHGNNQQTIPRKLLSYYELLRVFNIKLYLNIVNSQNIRTYQNIMEKLDSMSCDQIQKVLTYYQNYNLLLELSCVIDVLQYFRTTPILD
ncbi:Hypothetical_protein [Hexamita inflata]|uniref:Hypothetical_protein n=1 Tax=Hexamita inflata TaxID=28002 RepID=A0ABP1I9Y3_9EUKA